MKLTHAVQTYGLKIASLEVKLFLSPREESYWAMQKIDWNLGKLKREASGSKPLPNPSKTYIHFWMNDKMSTGLKKISIPSFF